MLVMGPQSKCLHRDLGKQSYISLYLGHPLNHFVDMRLARYPGYKDSHVSWIQG